MSLTTTIAARQQGPATVAVPIEDINDTNQAYEALMLDRIRLLDEVDTLTTEHGILYDRINDLDDTIEQLNHELFVRNLAMVAMREVLESQPIDF